jgi:hypothetical protein
MIEKANVMLLAIIAASCLVARLACAQETTYGHITSLQTFGEGPHVAPGLIAPTLSSTFRISGGET